ncbi:MAG: hypothetical protein ACI3YH_04670 [Eubacteriales bacterium]
MPVTGTVVVACFAVVVVGAVVVTAVVVAGFAVVVVEAVVVTAVVVAGFAVVVTIGAVVVGLAVVGMVVVDVGGVVVMGLSVVVPAGLVTGEVPPVLSLLSERSGRSPVEVCGSSAVSGTLAVVVMEAVVGGGDGAVCTVADPVVVTAVVATVCDAFNKSVSPLQAVSRVGQNNANESSHAAHLADFMVSAPRFCFFYYFINS